ncbi:hypothetical protein [Synechococcus elongatus]|uniref:YitT family protein n=1 Tax=Synechococcus elongatus PCC 11802 TaxID=2283154 RepID=A0AAT9JVX5_SYNEL
MPPEPRLAGRRIRRQWVKRNLLSMLAGLLIGSAWGVGSLLVRGSFVPFGLLLLYLGVCQYGLGGILCLALGVILESALLFGGIVGWAQQKLLRGWITSPKIWIGSAILGWGVFTVAIFNFLVSLSYSPGGAIASGLIAIAAGSGMGYGQSRQLGQAIAEPDRWFHLHVAMSVVSVIAISATELLGRPLGLSFLGSNLILILAVPIYTLLTGSLLAELTAQTEAAVLDSAG